MRLDQALASRFPQLSRRKARELIAAGRVLVNQRPVRIASREVNASDEVTFVEDAPAVPLIAITDEWLAVNKPAGMPTQPPRDRRVRSLEELLRVGTRRRAASSFSPGRALPPRGSQSCSRRARCGRSTLPSSLARSRAR
jgi:16S rRNA U516 pseudouridylate synthase RsuA-like enzyme